MSEARNEAALRLKWYKEYQEILPRLERAYKKASIQKREWIEKIDHSFHAWISDPAAPFPIEFLDFTRKLVPGSFSVITFHGKVQKPPLPVLSDAPGARAIESLPEWWPDDPVFHRTNAFSAIMAEGLCAPVAEMASNDPEYGWEAVWKEEVYSTYRHYLTKEQRRAFNAIFGEESARLVRKDEFGQLVSLFWVTKMRRDGRREGDRATLEVDLSKLRYYWWFPDEILGDASYCFVLPTDCPQALPDAFKLI